ncbi:MAG: hypothetical protein AB2A00_09695 [Myxococcota bacterium]
MTETASASNGQTAEGSHAPLVALLAIPAVAYLVGLWAMPHPAPVQAARATVDRTRMEGDVILKTTPTPKLLVNANFNDKITVLGLDIPEGKVGVGTRLPMTFYYRAESEMQEEWKVFLHIDSQSAQYRIHGDHFPPEGYNTDKWRKGDVVADRHNQWIPLDAHKGTYDIWLGFYDPAHEDDRLPLTTTPGVQTDGQNRVKLGTLVVE